jgi:DNA-binding NarL/FixJ family response regulator
LQSDDVLEMRGVLIVDDHPGFRAMARTMLEADGFDVVGEAPNGREALRLAAILRPDVVLLDVQLPDIDGFGVARALLVTSSAPQVVLVSTREAIDYGARIARSGASGFIQKARLSGTTLRATLATSEEVGT